MRILGLWCCLQVSLCAVAQDSLSGPLELGDAVVEPWDSTSAPPGAGVLAADSASVSWEERLAARAPASELISDSDWDELTGGRVYGRKAPEVVEAKPPNEGLDWLNGLLDGLSVLAWVLIAGLLVAIIVFLVYYNRRNTKVTPRGAGGGLTDELLGASRADIDEGLARNLADGDYRAAIRYRFGQVLQDLRAARHLRWVPGKTNEDYAAELPGGLRGGFGRLADSFAYAFYSGRPVDEAHYRSFATEADALAALISSPQNATR